MGPCWGGLARGKITGSLWAMILCRERRHQEWAGSAWVRDGRGGVLTWAALPSLRTTAVGTPHFTCPLMRRASTTTSLGFTKWNEKKYTSALPAFSLPVSFTFLWCGGDMGRRGSVLCFGTEFQLTGFSLTSADEHQWSGPPLWMHQSLSWTARYSRHWEKARQLRYKLKQNKRAQDSHTPKSTSSNKQTSKKMIRQLGSTVGLRQPCLWRKLGWGHP